MKTEKQNGTENRKKIYDYIVKYMTNNGYSPSVRDICQGTNLKSTSTVYRHLLKLEQMGKIHMQEKKTRTICLIGYKLIKNEENGRLLNGH